MRPELDDREWLNAKYEQRTAAEIGASVGVAASTVIAALERHGIGLRDPRAKQRRQMPRELDDPEWLRRRYATVAGTQIAAELGVSIATVHNTMRHFGIEADGPWVRRNITRHERPSDRQLAKVWDANGTIRVARPPRDCRAAADVASLRVGGVRRQSRPSRFDGARR